jgi:guanylate kinase
LSPRWKGKAKPTERLVVVSAPSGAGKTTLCEMLIRDFPNIRLSISTTTRPRRPTEKDGIHYQFVSPEGFQQKIDAGEFAEWAEVHGHSYGTSKRTIENALAAGKNVLFDIDVQGAMNLQKQYGERVLLIFILPPSIAELEQRLRNRKGDSPASIEKRLKNAYNELEWGKKFDYQITNDHLDRAYQELKEILRKECP